MNTLNISLTSCIGFHSLYCTVVVRVIDKIDGAGNVWNLECALSLQGIECNEQWGKCEREQIGRER